jgi:hypothetical protein
MSLDALRLGAKHGKNIREFLRIVKPYTQTVVQTYGPRVGIHISSA